MKVIHTETLRGGVKLEVISINGGRVEMHSDGQYRGAPMMVCFRGTIEDARKEYRLLKQQESHCGL